MGDNRLSKESFNDFELLRTKLAADRHRTPDGAMQDAAERIIKDVLEHHAVYVPPHGIPYHTKKNEFATNTKNTAGWFRMRYDHPRAKLQQLGVTEEPELRPVEDKRAKYTGSLPNHITGMILCDSEETTRALDYAMAVIGYRPPYDGRETLMTRDGGYDAKSTRYKLSHEFF